MKNVIKSIVFLLIFVFIWNCVFKILWLPKTPITLFYDEPKNYFDVVYYGGSNAYTHFNTTLAYDEYGFATGFMSTDSQPFGVIKYLMKDALKYQTPTLHVIDMYQVVADLENIDDASIRKSLDSMKFSQNRIDAVNELLTYNNTPKDEYVNYYFSFMMYHNVWKKIRNTNKIPSVGFSSLYRGYNFGTSTIEKVFVEDQVWTDNLIKLPVKNQEILFNLINYIKLNKINVLFIVPPRSYTEVEMGRLNDAVNIVEENDLNIINFNNLEDFQIDWSNDLYNSAHLNVYGATKFTLYLSKYLTENYNLPNHKGDSRYHIYESEYKRFKKDYRSLTKNDFDMLLQSLKN